MKHQNEAPNTVIFHFQRSHLSFESDANIDSNSYLRRIPGKSQEEPCRFAILERADGILRCMIKFNLRFESIIVKDTSVFLMSFIPLKNVHIKPLC